MSRPGTPLDDRPHFVYRCYDAEGQVLYIGMSSCVERRFWAHRTTAPWYPELDHVKMLGPFVGVGARRRAFAAEAAAIKTAKPPFNTHRGIGQRAAWARRKEEQKRDHARGDSCDYWRCRVCGGMSARVAQRKALEAMA